MAILNNRPRSSPYMQPAQQTPQYAPYAPVAGFGGAQGGHSPNMGARPGSYAYGPGAAQGQQWQPGSGLLGSLGAQGGYSPSMHPGNPYAQGASANMQATFQQPMQQAAFAPPRRTVARQSRGMLGY